VGLMLYAGNVITDKSPDVIAAQYLESMALFVKWLLENGYDIRLLIGDICDRPVIQQFKALLKERRAYDGYRVIDDPVESVDNLMWQLSKTDVVVATRFHNVLLALLLEKPVISISFHQKCDSLMSDMGLSEYCEEITGVATNRLIDHFVALQRNARDIEAHIEGKTAEFRAELDVQYGVMFGDPETRKSTPSRNPPNNAKLAGRDESQGGDDWRTSHASGA
jgi:polysaccharide pyruvyl transferase WcaK-like protein